MSAAVLADADRIRWNRDGVLAPNWLGRSAPIPNRSFAKGRTSCTTR